MKTKAKNYCDRNASTLTVFEKRKEFRQKKTFF